MNGKIVNDELQEWARIILPSGVAAFSAWLTHRVALRAVERGGQPPPTESPPEQGGE